jgi:ribosomal peptide maturation radical SAM protein 1
MRAPWSGNAPVTRNEPPRVLLGYLPFGLIQIAPLGLSLLKASLSRLEIGCDIRYFNLEFVDAFLRGSPDERARLYVRVTSRYQLAFAAEACVSELLFGPDAARRQAAAAFLSRALPDERAFLEGLTERFGQFLERAVAAIDWRRYQVLGLSSVFLGMTVPAVLFAREVKRRFPHIVTVLGGPNTEGPMGEALARRFSEIDYVLRGEADETWPMLVRAILDGRDPGPIPGLVHRVGEEVRAWPMRPIDRMDTLPFPDFDDFIEATRGSAYAARFRARLRLPFESSRGCWWGQKSHCKFCGINGQGMGYRSKSPARLMEEIEWLTARYRPHTLVAADAILDRQYFTTLLPTLAERRSGVSFSYEIKANVTREQMEKMRDAGIREILPGIETFSTRLLKLIKKGATSFDNLLCLKLAEECGITVSWYHMCGLPQERVEDYQQDIDVIRKVPHLQPPREIARFTLQRFTPYLQDAREEGLGNVRPMREYSTVFPFPAEELQELAYHFEFDFTDGRTATLSMEIEEMLAAAVTEWRLRYGKVALDLIPDGPGAFIVDTRGARAVVYLLDPAATRLYTDLERPYSALILSREARLTTPTAADDRVDDASTSLPRWARARHLEHTLAARLVRLTGPLTMPDEDERTAEERFGRWLDELAERGVLHAENGRYLALAVRRSEQWAESRYFAGADRRAEAGDPTLLECAVSSVSQGAN